MTTIRLLLYCRPKTLSLVQNSGTYFKCELIFVWKFPNSRCHGNSGWSDTNFIYTVKLADHENPLFGTRTLMISYTQAEL